AAHPDRRHVHWASRCRFGQSRTGQDGGCDWRWSRRLVRCDSRPTPCAERIILLGHHPDRIALGKQFGATDIVSERGRAAVEHVRELTGGFGAHAVLECVGLQDSVLTAMDIARPGDAIGRVGVPQADSIPVGRTFWKNVSVAGGPAPARAYIPQLLPDVLEGRIE